MPVKKYHTKAELRAAQNLQAKQWRQRNPEKVREIRRNYVNGHREQIRAGYRRIYRKNQARMIQKAREKYQRRKHKQAKWWKSYYKKNKAALSVRDAKRRALLKGAAINLAQIKEFTIEIRKSKSVGCYYCRTRINGKNAHFDHIVPLSRGGSHSIENLCVSCKRCNLSKGSKTIEEWIISTNALIP